MSEFTRNHLPEAKFCTDEERTAWLATWGAAYLKGSSPYQQFVVSAGTEDDARNLAEWEFMDDEQPHADEDDNDFKDEENYD